jgi:hypothetical protein
VARTFIRDSPNSFVLTATGNVASTLKWTSDNSDVAEVTESGVVTVKKAGNANLTVTAADEAKFSKTIVLKVDDFEPKFEGTKLTVYTTTDKTDLPIYANAANPIRGVAVESSYISGTTDGAYVTVKGAVAKKTTEKLKFTLITDLGEYTTDEIAVTIDPTTPSVKFKQSGKLNTFYKNGTATFSVTSKNQIEDIKVSADDTGYTADFDGSTLTLRSDKLTKTTGAIDVNLIINLKDYGKFTYPLTIATEYKTPSLAINTASIVGNQTNVTTSVIDKKTKAAVTAAGLTVQPTDEIKNAEIDESGNLTFTCAAGTNTTYKVNVGSDDWNGTVSLTGKVTYAKNPKVVFGSKAAIITSIAKKSVVPVSIKDSSVKFDAQSSIEKPKKVDSNLSVYFDPQLQSIVAKYNGDVAKGSYSYTFTPSVDGVKLKSTKIKVNVLPANQSASVTFKTKGTINLVNANEYITVTPTLKNTTANVESIQLTGTGADKFVIEPLGNGTYKLSYDDELVAGLKATQYTLTANVTLDDGTPVSNGIKVKPVIKLPKIKADVTKATLYTNSNKAFTANLTTTSKTGSNAIERIELAPDTKNNTDKYFNVTFVPNEITPSNGKVTISLSDKEIPAGKYTLTCKVYYKSGAETLTEKNAATVKFTVTIK